MRKQLTKIALIASIALALAFALSCSTGDSEESNTVNVKDVIPSSSGGGNPSSSSNGGGIGSGDKPVCSAIFYGIGMCFEGGNLTKEACDEMNAPVPTQWQENGSCPSGGTKCSKSYYGDGTGYAYGNYSCPS